MSTNNIASLVTFFITLALGLFIFVKNPKSKINLTFTFFTLTISAWVITNFFADIAKTPEQAAFWARATLAGPSIMPILLLYFSTIFPKQQVKFNKIIWLILTIPSIVFLILTPTKLNIEKVNITA